MDIDWDPDKAESNLRKHGVDFADAVTVMGDERALTIIDDHEQEQEQRFVTIGTDATARVLVVVYVFRGDVVRISSARKATSRERRQYEVAP